jgi:peptide-methionine (S)-S-oxide reductase
MLNPTTFYPLFRFNKMKWILSLLMGIITFSCQAKNEPANKIVSSNQAMLSDQNTNYDTITLGGGCFWCIEAVFQRLNGVQKVISGYTGGSTKNPTYKEICTGLTGHAEVVQVIYDPKIVSFTEILEVFFTVHDPTTLNRQGADEGTQYRSEIFYHTEEQKLISEQIIKELDASKAYSNPIVTKVSAIGVFYGAEDYHQNYFNENPRQPYCSFVVAPKVEKFEKVFKDKLKKP